MQPLVSIFSVLFAKKCVTVTFAGDTLAAEIRAARKQRNLSQEALADILGTSRFRVIAWEKGHSRPASGYAVKLTEALGLPAELFEAEEPVGVAAAVEQGFASLQESLDGIDVRLARLEAQLARATKQAL